ncbi:MAG: hypothetical protein IQL11_13305 [Bacteroidales bacterium]|nr:hypothetical protein [Bacteroidales bacterium]
MSSRNYLSWIILILLLCLYMFFPSGSSTTDAWYYAACVRYQDEIFHPHHLLYNLLGYVFCLLPSKAGIDVLASLKVLNSLFAVSALIVIQRILRMLGYDRILMIVVTCLCGFSFSVMRYATENETYIVPLFFAFAASYSLLQYFRSGEDKSLLSAAVWITMAVLFHQVYIFWWIGFFVSFILAGKKRPLLIYLFISLSGPLVYLLVIRNVRGDLQLSTITDFILGDLREGGNMNTGGKGMIFSIINLFRSYVQVHGYIFNLIKSNILYVIPGIVAAGIAAYSLFGLPLKAEKVSDPRFAYTHLLIIILQFIFAALASGNAEFMVMIPVLTFILVPLFTRKCERFFVAVLAGIAVWNISYGLIPLHYKSDAPEQFLCGEAFSNSGIIVVASDDQLLRNMLYYQTGVTDIGNIYRSPANMRIKGLDPATLVDVIDDALASGSTVYTDCTGPAAVSRASITEGRMNEAFFRIYELIPVRTWPSAMGTRTVFRVMRKM